MTIKQIIFVFILSFIKFDFVKSDCYSFSNGYCGGVADFCPNTLFVQDSVSTCVRCSQWKDDACGKKGDQNICSHYERSNNQYCQLKCSINTPNGCGEGHSRCQLYKSIDQNTCVDCTKYINNKCGDSDKCEEYQYDSKKNLCQIKCEQLSNKQCGGDASRCKEYGNIAYTDVCVDCTQYSNGYCGGKINAEQCFNLFTQDKVNTDKCVYRCEIKDNLACGGDYQRCKHYQYAGSGRCINCLNYFDGRGCGYGDYGLCKEYYKVSYNECKINCNRQVFGKCGGELGESECKGYTKVNKNECYIVKDKDDYDDIDDKEKDQDQSYSMIIQYSITILLIIISL